MAPGGGWRAALLLATLTLLAILFPTASAASSPPIAGLSPTASASSTPLVITNTDDASASPSPPAVFAWTPTRSAEAAAPPPVGDEPYHDAASPPPPPVSDEPYRDAASPPPPPVADEPYRDAASPPPPPLADEPFRDATSPTPSSLVADEPYHDRDAMIPSPPRPVADEPYRDAAAHEDAARVVSSCRGDDLGLQQIAKVLASLGYNEMASSAALLADSTPVVTWPGAITVFGAPDVFLKHSCPDCSRRRLVLDHMAMGYFPYAELAAAPSMKIPSASVGFCLDVAAHPQRGAFSVHGVMVSEPELYDDGRYVVHGLHGFIPPLSHVSCVEDAHAHRHQLSATSAAASAATAASVVRIMIREAISRLRGSGFGFVALAMRVKLAELEKLSNLTVFALDDQVIFTGGGQAQGYASAVRFHIVPGHRLTRADLLILRPGTVLPTLAGENQKLVITLGADEVRVNYIAVKEPDVVINSRVAVHGIYLPFPRLHIANLAASVAVASDIGSPSGNATAGSATVHQRARSESVRSGHSASASPGSATATAVVTRLTVGSGITRTTPTSTPSSSSPRRTILLLSLVAAILAVAAAGVLAVGGGGSDGDQARKCQICFDEASFFLQCCNKRVCNFCLRDYIRGEHAENCDKLAAGKIAPLLHPHQLGKGRDLLADYTHLPQYPPWYFYKSARKNSRLHLFYYNLQELEGGAEPRVTEIIHHVLPPEGELSDPPIICDIQPMVRPFSEL